MKERAAYFALAAQAQVAVEARRKELDEKRKELDEKRKELDESERSWMKRKRNPTTRSHSKPYLQFPRLENLTVYYQLRNKVLPRRHKENGVGQVSTGNSLWKIVLFTLF